MREDATARTRANFEAQGDNLEDHTELRSESLQAISVVLLCQYCLTIQTRQLLRPVWSTLVPHDSFPEREARHCTSRDTEARLLQRHSHGSDTAATAIMPLKVALSRLRHLIPLESLVVLKNLISNFVHRYIKPS